MTTGNSQTKPAGEIARHLASKMQKLAIAEIVSSVANDGEPTYSFTHNGQEYVCFNAREIEDEMDDLLDGGRFRALEAQDYARYEDRAFGL